MFICNKCRSTSIKIRTNSRFGKKDKPTPVWCKKCGCTDIGVMETRDNKRRRGPPRFGQGQQQGGGAPPQRR